MEEQTAVGLWVALGILAIVVAALVGFWVGRVTSDERKLIRQLEEELDQRMQELTRYRSQVNDHFDRTATLFASMAGTYRDLYHHLAQSAEELADKPTRERLEDRAGKMLANTHQRDFDPGQGGGESSESGDRGPQESGRLSDASDPEEAGQRERRSDPERPRPD